MLWPLVRTVPSHIFWHVEHSLTADEAKDMAESSGQQRLLGDDHVSEGHKRTTQSEYALHQECLWLLRTVPHVSLTAMEVTSLKGRKPR